jgi:hypothetical protein
MKTAIRSGERYFGVEITPDGNLVVAERAEGKTLPTTQFPAGEGGAQAFRRHIEHECAHPHVCIKACGAAALSLATSLMPTPGIELTIVSRQAIQDKAASPSAEERAARLAKLAERLF